MPTIFLVDDNYSLLLLYQKLFTLKGYNVIGAARNGIEAITMFKKFTVKPDVIIMDYRMPIKNGIEATKEILQINKHSKIIFASADERIENEALSIGASAFKLKPFNIDNLIGKINETLLKN
ncbi:MAG: response regulator [Candidatus Helarchaeota archaeon]|nr:response regulator [Candidatus Helarchaeota archaeon]